MATLIEILNNPEEHYPGNFDTPKRANALLTGLCQEAATEIENNGVIIEYHEATIKRQKAEIERLNKAVAAEREACAAICDQFQARDVGMQPAECAGAIRARGNSEN